MEIHNIESFLSYRRNVRGRTMRVIEAAPADKLEWRHADGAFSAGDLARHIAATERYTFAENVLGRPSRYSGCGRELADGRDHVIAFMCRMHEGNHGHSGEAAARRPGAQMRGAGRLANHHLETVARHDRA
jgi:hypothetical protein